MPEVTWELSDRGVKAISDRRLPDGTVLHRISEAVLPTLRVIPNPRVAQYARVETIGWVLPIDDTSFRIYTAGRVRSPGEIASVRSRLHGKLWEELTDAEHRDFPGDYEAQVGQGPITLHSEENLVSSDRGVASSAACSSSSSTRSLRAATRSACPSTPPRPRCPSRPATS
jgi:hypothetical protein